MADLSQDVTKKGNLKVRRKDEKKFKKRWAVLRKDSGTVEIYESDKKWRAGEKYKMAIALRPCFSVSAKVEPKSKYAIGLMGATSYSFGLETEDEQIDWLLKLRWVHQGGRDGDERPRTLYERMWDVTITDRGLGSTKRLNGQYCVGLTADGIQLINKDRPDETYDLPFTTIRGCRHMECFFWMEVGRTSCFGAGEIYMQLEERIYAQNMHEVMKAKFNSRSSDSDGQTSESRPRAPSTSEPTGPIYVKGRRNTYSSNNSSQASMTSIPMSTTPGRDRSGSVPSRPRTISEGNSDRHHHHASQGHYTRPRTTADSRTHAVHSRSSSITAGSPPVLGSPFSPASVESNSSYSMDDHGHPVTPDSTIVEEGGDYLPVDPGRGYGLDIHDGPGRKRSIPPLTLPIPACSEARSSGGESPYLPMTISPGAGGRHVAPSGGDSAYLPMFYSPGGADTPDGPIMSPTPSQGARGSHSRDSSLTEEGYVPMYRCAADPTSHDTSYMSMKPGPSFHTDETSHSRSSSVPETDGYVPMMPGQLSYTIDNSSPYMDLQPGKRASKISDDSYAEVSPASSCSLTSGTPVSEPHLERAPLTVLTPPSEDTPPAAAADGHNRGDHESMRTRASSLGSRLSHVLMPRRRDRSESDSASAERPSTGEPGAQQSSGAACGGSPSLSSSLDSTVTSLKEVHLRRRRGETCDQAGSPATDSKGSQDSLRHRPRSNSQSSQGSEKAHSAWRFLFSVKRRDKRSDKKSSSVPVDVPAGRGSPAASRLSRSPGPADAPLRLDADRQADSRRRRVRRRDPPAAHYTEDDYLVMGPIHLDDEAATDTPQLRRQPPRKASAADQSGYLPMDMPLRVASPPAEPQPSDYLNMDMSARRAAAPATGDYLNMEISQTGRTLLVAAEPAQADSDYLPMTPAAVTSAATSSATSTLVPAVAVAAASAAPAPAVTAVVDAGDESGGDYLQMSMGPRPPSVLVQRSLSARTSAEREVEMRPASRRDPHVYSVLEVPVRPVSALVDATPAAAESPRRNSDADERRRGQAAKVQRKYSVGAPVGGLGLLRKLDAISPRTMFRSLSQRGKKESRRAAGASEPHPPPPPPPVPLGRSRSWVGSSQSLSSSNSIQEEVETDGELTRPAEPELRFGSASPCDSAASVTPRASLAGSQVTTPRQTPAPTPTPLTTSNSLTNFGATAPTGPVRQRHESNPPPSSLQRPPRQQTGVGSQSLTTLPTEEQELVYASLDLADPESAACQPASNTGKLAYASIVFKSEALDRRDS